MARKKAKKKSALKSKAKKAGRKIKKAAKTDVGRAGIGGGIGALALGPIGAVAGAGIAMATKKKKKGKNNPARAFSLETEVKRGRQGRAKGAAGRATLASAAASDASRISLKSRLAKINPHTYLEEIPKLSNRDLAEEVVAVEALIQKAERHPQSSKRVLKDLKVIRTALRREEKSRRLPNPVSSGYLTDRTLAELAATYRTRRRAHLNLVTSPGSSPGQIASAKKRLDDAEQQLILYAEVKNMDPEDLRRFMQYADTKRREAKKKAKRKAKSNPSAAKISERELSIVEEMPHLGTLGRYPRAVHMWESVYISARTRGFSKARSAKQAWGAVKETGYYVDSKGMWRMPRRRFNPGEHPKENPLQKIPKGASVERARAVIGHNIAAEIEAGRPQRQAVAISLASARRDAPKLVEKMYGPRQNPYLGDAVARAKAKKEAAQAAEKRRRKTPPPPPPPRRRKPHTVTATNPRKTSESKRLIDRCQKLWDEYCERPTKKRLRAVLEHLEKMKASSSKTVKGERSRCFRVANKEAKRLKMRM